MDNISLFGGRLMGHIERLCCETHVDLDTERVMGKGVVDYGLMIYGGLKYKPVGKLWFTNEGVTPGIRL